MRVNNERRIKRNRIDCTSVLNKNKDAAARNCAEYLIHSFIFGSTFLYT